MEQFFDADIIFLQKFFGSLVEQIAPKSFGSDREQFIPRAKRRCGMTNFTKDRSSEMTEFIFAAENFCNGERMIVFEQGTRERVVRANGGRW